MVKSLWPLVVLVALALASVTVLLALHVETLVVVALIGTLVTPIINFVILDRVNQVSTQTQQVATQTNGMSAQKDALMLDMWNHIKSSTPVTAPATEVPSDGKPQ